MTKRLDKILTRVTRTIDIRDYVTTRIFCYRDSFGRVSRRVILRQHERTWRVFS